MLLKELVNQLMQSYQDHPIKKDHCSCRMPSNKEVKKIIQDAKYLLFPGYFTLSNVDEYGSLKETRLILRRLRNRLRVQIGYALLYLADKSYCKTIQVEAKEKTDLFLSKLSLVRAYMHTDLEAHFEGDPAAFNKDTIVVSYPGFYAILVYRLAHELQLIGVPILPRMMSEFAHRETGIDIGAGASIGKYFFIDHGTGVVIGETSTIGEHVKIYQGVTLGAISTSAGRKLVGVKRHPTIGNYVTIYAGASILGGNTTIGNYSTIGSNAFVTESVKEYSKVSIKSPELIYKDQTGGMKP